MKRKSVLLAIAACVAVRLFAGDEEPERGAKEIFWDPNRPPVEEARAPVPAGTGKRGGTTSAASHATHATEHVRTASRADGRAPTSQPFPAGIRYWIELVDPGQPAGTPVTGDRVFHSGDRIRLHFSGNSDGRIMILQLGSSGTASVLYPDPRKGIVDNAIVANVDQVLPTPQHWFRFDDQAGTERLLVLFARSQRDIEETYHVRPQMDAIATAEILETIEGPRGRKDLRIETETADPQRIGTYTVSVDGKPVVLQIVLRHA